VRRLVVSRNHAGLRLGTTLLDWAGLTAREDYGAEWIRVDVWRTHKELHAYFEREGFSLCGGGTDPACPSGALFQKPTDQLTPHWPRLFHEA
jgi:hypothetical protein